MKLEQLSKRVPGIIGEKNYRDYSVLIPLVKNGTEVCMLFEKRAESLRHQPGEICFPGGKMEPGETPQECAVRETMEELLIQQEQIFVYGPSDILVSPFQIRIHPFIGEIREFQNTFSADEVQKLILIPVSYLLETKPQQYASRLHQQLPEDFPYDWIPGGQEYRWAKGSYEIIFYRYQEHVIWGMTAQILRSAIELLQSCDL